MIQRSHLWIVTLLLTAVVVACAVFLFFVREKLPMRRPLAIDEVKVASSESTAPVDVSRIYNNDLFGTYEPRSTEQPVEKPQVPDMPQPPKPRQAEQVKQPEPEFLPALNVVLRGIISSTDESYNRAIISDEKSGQESLYGVGDMIDDGEIIRITATKVILIRSNGQEEILFVAASDLASDNCYMVGSWSEVVKNKDDGTYGIDHKKFVERVPTVADFLDMLDITAAYQKGAFLGCRVGAIADDSLAKQLGLLSGDIITSIDDMPTNTTRNRLDVYKHIAALPLNSQIHVSLLRDGKLHDLVYVLQQVAESRDTQKRPRVANSSTKTAPKARVISNRLVTQAAPRMEPQVKQVQKRDRQAMLRHGGKRAMLQRES